VRQKTEKREKTNASRTQDEEGEALPGNWKEPFLIRIKYKKKQQTESENERSLSEGTKERQLAKGNSAMQGRLDRKENLRGVLAGTSGPGQTGKKVKKTGGNAGHLAH